MVKVQTTRFGEITVSEKSVVNMPEGMVGFGDYKRYVLLEDKPDTPLKWLQSLDEPSLAFIVVNPLEFVDNYDFDIPDEDADMLGLESPDHAVVLTTVTVDANGCEVTTNLLGPIVINSLTLDAKQIVVQDERYGTKHLIGKNAGAVPAAHAVAKAA